MDMQIMLFVKTIIYCGFVIPWAIMVSCLQLKPTHIFLYILYIWFIVIYN